MIKKNFFNVSRYWQMSPSLSFIWWTFFTEDIKRIRWTHPYHHGTCIPDFTFSFSHYSALDLMDIESLKYLEIGEREIIWTEYYWVLIFLLSPVLGKKYVFETLAEQALRHETSIAFRVHVPLTAPSSRHHTGRRISKSERSPCKPWYPVISVWPYVSVF